MATDQRSVPLEQLRVADAHELFAEMRESCPMHWSSGIEEWPQEAGFWSIVRADDVHAISRDWETWSSEKGGFTAALTILPLELQQAMFIGMDPPKHDRLKTLFQKGFTPKRIAEHEPAIRAITTGVLDGLAGRETCDLVTDVAQPVVARVIGSFMGIPPEDDIVWAQLMATTLGAGDPDITPEGPQTVIEREVPEILRRCGELIAARRAVPTCPTAPCWGSPPCRHAQAPTACTRCRHRGRWSRWHRTWRYAARWRARWHCAPWRR